MPENGCCSRGCQRLPNPGRRQMLAEPGKTGRLSELKGGVDLFR